MHTFFNECKSSYTMNKKSSNPNLCSIKHYLVVNDKFRYSPTATTLGIRDGLQQVLVRSYTAIRLRIFCGVPED